jgi:membrane protein implicated in regulation of membrane protease activity
VNIGLIYVGLLTLGVVYGVIAGIMGWFSDLFGGDIHVDASGHLDAGHAHPISGTIVATFVTGFGGGGVMAHYLFEWTMVPGLGFATVSGLVLAGAAFLLLDLVFKHTQAGSEFTTDDLVGREAQVITPIPEGGTGEVAYLVKGQREESPAQTLDGKAVAKGQLVVIEKVVGSTVYVRSRA